MDIVIETHSQSMIVREPSRNGTRKAC